MHKSLMNARLIKFWNDLQSSYYFIPGLMALGAIFLAVFTSHIDKTLEVEIADKLGWFYSNKADGARAILTTIAGSMMTVAAVTFSITMVAVTSAAGQYGPRLIGNFMRDRANQITLGTFTSTFVYCLLILRVARTGDASGVENAVTEFVPNVSLLVAMLMTMFSVGVMIFFIHHIPETLNVGNITGKVGRKLRNDIKAMFPKEIGEGEEDAQENSKSDDDIDEALYDNASSFQVTATAEGYIQAVNEDAILEWARANNSVVRMQYRPGDFAVKGNSLMQVWTLKGEKTEPDEDALQTLRNSYAMGQDRTAHQNILFLADELVEILARALSPGVNDPFTAINCINWFHSGIKAMMSVQRPSPFRRDDDGKLRVIAHAVSFERFISVICDQSRPYISADRNAALKMLTVLTELAAEAENDQHRKILIKRIDNLRLSVKDNMPSSFDRQELENRFKQSERMIADKDYYTDILNSDGWGGGRS